MTATKVEVLANPEFGDTGGAILAVDDMTLSAGTRDIVIDVNWKVMEGDRVGLVGGNGMGKSTVLSAVAGRRSIEAGKALVKPGTTVGYLVQTAVSGSTRTAWEEAESGMERIKAAEARLAVAEERLLKEESAAAAEELVDAQNMLENVGGNAKEVKIERVMSGLGFTRADHNKTCDMFSGGWQMRIALARLLLSEPDLLLLDEPTNHLDTKAKMWLSRYLAEYKGTVVIVSHEEALLEGAGCTQIAEIRDKKLHLFKCSYSKFLVEREERVILAAKAYEAQQKEIDKLQSYVDRFGAKASKASSAQSRKKQLEKMDVLEAPENLESGRRPKLVLPPPPKCRADMVVLRQASIGWQEDKALYNGLDLTIERGMRLVILGPNGCGKSTLLWALAGKLPLLSGSRKTTEGLNMGLFTQDLAQELDPEAVALDTVMQSVQDIDPSVTFERARAAMGALGLTGDKALQKIGTMSGGEKARVALAMFVLLPHNLLLLDEPSNHLDVRTVEALTEALQDYTGTVAVVTHNRQFCERLSPTHVAVVQPGGKFTLQERALRDSDFEAMTLTPPAPPK